jgi:hypothetical protein
LSGLLVGVGVSVVSVGFMVEWGKGNRETVHSRRGGARGMVSGGRK